MYSELSDSKGEMSKHVEKERDQAIQQWESLLQEMHKQKQILQSLEK